MVQQASIKDRLFTLDVLTNYIGKMKGNMEEMMEECVTMFRKLFYVGRTVDEAQQELEMEQLYMPDVVLPGTYQEKTPAHKCGVMRALAEGIEERKAMVNSQQPLLTAAPLSNQAQSVVRERLGQSRRLP